MAMAIKRVAVIGGGPAGLTAAKSMLDVGIVPTVFDKSPGIGGMWNADVNPSWASLHTNLSRYTTCYSDFPWSRALSPIPDFPTQKDVQTYLTAYARENLKPDHWSMETTVTSIVPAVNHTGDSKPPAWVVHWSSPTKGQHTEVFDFVVIATGFFSQPHIPNVPGLDTFPGKILHSGSYRRPEEYAGQRVVVVGAAFSGAEVAAELASHAANVVHVITKAFWVIPRYLPTSPTDPAPTFIPLDFIFYRRSTRKSPHESTIDTVGSPAINGILRSMVGDQGQLLSPHLAVTDTDPMFVAISEKYAARVREGKIDVRRGRVTHISTLCCFGLLVTFACMCSLQQRKPCLPVTSIQGASVVLEDGSRLSDADTIIFCTGFRPALPFLSPSVLSDLCFNPTSTFQPVLLHRNVFHPTLPGMAFVGMYRGPHLIAMEMQARWAAAVFSGALPPIPESVMLAGIEREKAIRDQVPRPQFPHGDVVGLADDFARDLGIFHDDPDFWKQHDLMLSAQYRSRESAEVATAQMKAACHEFAQGRKVAAAVFKSLQGSWRLSRRIDSRLSTSPSGTVTGTATFTPIPPPCPNTTPHQQEYLYREEGEFQIDGGGKLRMWREYVYVYDEKADKMSVYFAKGSTKDYLFHEIRILPPAPPAASPAEAGAAAAGATAVGASTAAGATATGVTAAGATATGASSVSPSAAGDVTPAAANGTSTPTAAAEQVPPRSTTGGWHAVGEQHLCGRDLYDTDYRFAFKGIHLQEVEVSYSVKGPEKDYTSTAVYVR